MTDIDQRLRAAADRLHATEPDQLAARQAFERRHTVERASEPVAGRNWWPTLAVAALAAAAVIGVVTYGSIGNDATVLSPTDSPVTEPTPPTSSDTDAEAPPVVATELAGPTTTTLGANSSCEVSDRVGVAPAGSAYVVVSCVDVEGSTAALVAEIPSNGSISIESATRWFVDSPRLSDTVVELGPAAPVTGLANAVSFVTELDDVTTCATIVDQRLGGDWKETCWVEALTPQLITDWDGMIVQFDLTDPASIVAHRLDDGPAWPASGCDVFDLGEMIARSDFAGSMYTAAGCDGAAAAISEGASFLQPGPPDGSIWLFERIDDTWQPVDNGTGVETDLLSGVPPYEEWATLVEPLTYDGSGGLACYSPESRSDTYDYVSDAVGSASVEAAAEAWWQTDGPADMDRSELELLTNADSAEITYVDSRGNAQLILVFTEIGGGWLVETANICPVAPPP